MNGPLIDNDRTGRSADVWVIADVTCLTSNRDPRSNRQRCTCRIFQQRVAIATRPKYDRAGSPKCLGSVEIQVAKLGGNVRITECGRAIQSQAILDGHALIACYQKITVHSHCVQCAARHPRASLRCNRSSGERAR